MREAHDLLGSFLLSGEKAVVADGANRFDAYRVAGLARAAGRNPREALAAARVSRAFAWQQWLVLLEEKAVPEATRSGARAVFVLGPLDLLADHDLKEPAARSAAQRVVEALGRMARANLRVVAAQKERRLREAKREYLLDSLRRSCRVVEAGVPSPSPAKRSAGAAKTHNQIFYSTSSGRSRGDTARERTCAPERDGVRVMEMQAGVPARGSGSLTLAAEDSLSRVAGEGDVAGMGKD